MFARALSWFNAHAASIELGRLFDLRSRWVYILLTAGSLCSLHHFLFSAF